MPAKKKKPSEKLSIQEYLKKREQLSKKRFKISLYPWPVTMTLLLPLGVFLILLCTYFFYIRSLGE